LHFQFAMLMRLLYKNAFLGLNAFHKE